MARKKSNAPETVALTIRPVLNNKREIIHWEVSNGIDAKIHKSKSAGVAFLNTAIEHNARKGRVVHVHSYGDDGKLAGAKSYQRAADGSVLGTDIAPKSPAKPKPAADKPAKPKRTPKPKPASPAKPKPASPAKPKKPRKPRKPKAETAPKPASPAKPKPAPKPRKPKTPKPKPASPAKPAAEKKPKTTKPKKPKAPKSPSGLTPLPKAPKASASKPKAPKAKASGGKKRKPSGYAKFVQAFEYNGADPKGRMKAAGAAWKKLSDSAKAKWG